MIHESFLSSLVRGGPHRAGGPYPAGAQDHGGQGPGGKQPTGAGGSGPYKVIVVSEPTLASHAVYRPKDLSPFGKDNKLPIVLWGNGGDLPGFSSEFFNSEDGKVQAGVIVNVNPIPKAVSGEPLGVAKRAAVADALGRKHC